MALPAGTRLGPYEIVGAIGAGGMGEVYRARDTRLERDVAIKVLPPQLTESAQALERFQREARAASALNHPNICTIYDVGSAPLGPSGGERRTAPFIAFELLDGETLQQAIARGALEIATLVDVALAVTSALDAAHGKGIIHRDIKPSNLFLTPHGPKVLDFGLAKTARPPAAAVAVTRDVTRPVEAVVTDPGSTVGTVAYMSPEQLRGRELDARTDLFSLGLVLYEMATGRPAFHGDTTAVISGAILHEAPVAPRQWRPDLSVELERIVLKLLEKDREDRYQTAADLRADLRRAKREIDSGSSRVLHASPQSTTRTASSSTSEVRSQTATDAPAVSTPSSDSQVVLALISRHRGKLIGAVIVALVIAGGSYGVWRSRPPAASRPPDAASSALDLQVSQLTLTGNAAFPAISPDGKYVAYVQTDPPNPSSLWIRQTATGSNVQIVPPAKRRGEGGVQVPAFISGATVTPDGGFVDFVRQSDAPARSALWRVPFLGGTPRKLIDDAAGSPVSWSPDGRQLAFVRTVPGRSYSVVLADADGGHERVLVTRTRPATFSNLVNSPVGIPPAWSPDGATLALPGAETKASGLERQFVFIGAGDGAVRIVPVESVGEALGLVWLDASTLVFNGQAEAGGAFQLWRLSYPDGKLTRLTNDLNDYFGISLTADRSTLVTARTEQRVGLWVGDATGTSGADVTAPVPFRGRLGFFGLQWAGDRLLYDRSTSGQPSVMRLVPGTGSSEEIVSKGANASATADGGTIVYESTDPGLRGTLWKANADGQRAVLLVSGGASEPIVLPDDRHVLFRSSRASGVLSPWIVPLEGGEPTEVTHLPSSNQIRVSQDGKSILFMTPGEQTPYVVICDLPSCTSQRRSPAYGRWTPDGQGVAVILDGNIWVQPLDGKAPRALTHFTDATRTIATFAWSRDGKRLAIARAATTSDLVLFKGVRR